ncbi:MAG: hypothetical protein V4813_15300 [Gemmatimonadota bacterium]
MRINSWRTLQASAVIVGLGSLAACAGKTAETATDSGMAVAPVSADSTAATMNMKWTTTLEPRGGTNVRGTASVSAGASQGTTTAEVAINGAPKDGTHPWHVHAGTCAASGAIVGPAADYPALKADSSGTATATATVNVAPPTSGDYHVNVHLSPTEMGTIVACGDLKMAGM